MHRTPAALIIVLLLIGSSACQSRDTQRQTFLQFGTLVEVTLSSRDEGLAEDSFAAIEQLLDQRHSDWHGWLDGDLSAFNRALADTNTAVPIPPSLRQLIQDSKYYYALSEGRFNPALGQLVAAWGFHQSAAPDRPKIAAIQQSIPGMDDLEVVNGRATSRNQFLQLDFGGIAKGLAIAEISALLRERGFADFIINAGGDVYAAGSKAGRPWTVAIENPFQPGVLASFKLPAQTAIFTSGDYRRYFRDDDGSVRHHIIDPRTGQPARHASSATVVHADPVRADAAATALMLSSIEDLPALAARLQISQFLVIDENANAFCSQALCEQLQWIDEHGLEIKPL